MTGYVVENLTVSERLTWGAGGTCPNKNSWGLKHFGVELIPLTTMKRRMIQQPVVGGGGKPEGMPGRDGKMAQARIVDLPLSAQSAVTLSATYVQ
jgi:hypothetical protein